MNFDYEAVRGEVGQIHAQNVKRKGAPPASTGTTTTTVIPEGEQMHPNLPWDNAMLFSDMVPVVAINSGNVQTSACAGSDSSIFVSSMVFPRMEGCFFPLVVDGSLEYTKDAASISILESTTTTQVSF